MSAGFPNSPIVVKVGGGALRGGALEDLPGILAGGTPVVIVHGGGPQLTRMLDALGMESRFHEGLRVTDEAAVEVAEMVFAGGVNKGLVRKLKDLGVPVPIVIRMEGTNVDEGKRMLKKIAYLSTMNLNRTEERYYHDKKLLREWVEKEIGRRG